MFTVKCRNRFLRISLIFSIITVASFLFSRKYFEEEFVSVDNPLPLDLSACGNFPCIGNSLCQAFSKGLVRIKKSEEPRKDGAWTVFRGILKDKNHALRYKNCSIRVFGADKGFPETSNENFSLFKRLLCQSFGMAADCDPQVTLQSWKLLQNVISSTGILDANLVQGLSLPLKCPSQRFVNRIVRRSASGKNGFITLHNLKEFEKASLLLRLKIAPKMWMNEAFPSNEGWPFGINYGACGRIVLNKEEGSVTLAALYNETWKKRVDMAVQTFTDSLNNQLHKCSSRSEGIDYFGVAESIKRMLGNVRPCSDEIPYRFPECEYMQ